MIERVLSEEERPRTAEKERDFRARAADEVGEETQRLADRGVVQWTSGGYRLLPSKGEEHGLMGLSPPRSPEGRRTLERRLFAALEREAPRTAGELRDETGGTLVEVKKALGRLVGASQVCKLEETGAGETVYDAPAGIDTAGRRAIWRALEGDADLALQVDAAVRAARPDAWRGDLAKERTIKAAILPVVGSSSVVERVFTAILDHEEYE